METMEAYKLNYKSEVYHHCLFGTRYDFLCANYTAFDQTLFNCNFVSNVDCENSKNFWHRNDELYIEKSTTTTAPPINYNFYTPPPKAAPLTPSPVGGPVEAPPPPPRRQPAVRPRAPRPPVRPVYDYYDEYEELPRPKIRKRPRARPRPVYYDDYEEYEDVRVGRRGGGRRPYARRDRLSRRSKDRRKVDYEDDYVYEDEDFVISKKQKPNRRKLLDDDEYEDERPFEKRRPQNRRDKPPRKPLALDDYDYEEDDRLSRRSNKEENRGVENRQPLSEDSKKIPRLGKRRPPSQEYEDDLQQADDSDIYERPRKSTKEQSYIKPPDNGRPIIKPVSGTLYDRPRVAPRINPPVPKNAADKFSYKSLRTPTTPADKEAEEDYDEYEETEKIVGSDKKLVNSRTSISKVKQDDEDIKTSSTSKPKSANTNRKLSEETEDDYEDQASKAEKPASKSTTTTTTEPEPMPIIRKFKRPFLPSRGGSPYSSRNLQPVGAKAAEETLEIDLGESSLMKSVADPSEPNKNTKDISDTKTNLRKFSDRGKSPLSPKVTITTAVEESTLKSAIQEIAKEEPTSGVIRIKVPIRVKPYIDPEESRSHNPFSKYSISETVTSTQQPTLAKDGILNGNYDVSLNEAISPIIPNIPVRSFGGYNPSTDYSYKRFQRPTKYVILDPVVSAGSTYYVR